MTSHMATEKHRIDEMARTAKSRFDKIIENVADAASHAAEKAGTHVQHAGEKVTHVGEKMAKLGDSR
jgi:hypothetical protein